MPLIERPLRVLVSASVHRRFWPKIAEAAPAAAPLRFTGDATVVDEDDRLVVEPDAEVAFMSYDLIDGDLIRSFFPHVFTMPSLQWLQSMAAGLDVPVFRAVLERGVRMTSSRAGSISIAEWVLRSVLEHYQQPGLWAEAQGERAWRHHRFREVHDTTWVVVGLGSIGREVARRAEAFGAHVIGVRRHPRGDEGVECIALEALPDVLPHADVVVLAAPPTAEARGLVDDAFLTAMRDRAVLVNISRGALVDEGALLRALDRGVPEAAILDVFETEPLPADSRLWTHPRVIVTPHNSAGGTGSLDRGAREFADNLRLFVAGEPLDNEVTLDAIAEQLPG